jgi:ABC-2 type transport system permease protein
MHPLIPSLSMVLGAFCFTSLGILLSIYPSSDIPATVMMLTSR